MNIFQMEYIAGLPEDINTYIREPSLLEGITFIDTQADIIRYIADNDVSIMNCPRRCGKTVASLAAIGYYITKYKDVIWTDLGNYTSEQLGFIFNNYDSSDRMFYNSYRRGLIGLSNNVCPIILLDEPRSNIINSDLCLRLAEHSRYKLIVIGTDIRHNNSYLDRFDIKRIGGEDEYTSV